MALPVIAISGPPGAGKTTLLAGLAERLRPVAVVEYDRYEQVTSLSPDAIADWLAHGADYDALPLGALAADLAGLKQATTAGRSEGTRPLVLFDTLVGRAHAATAQLIDRLVWIDVPLDVALARKIGAMARLAADEMPRAQAAARFVDWTAAYCRHYERFIHRTYAVQRDRVRPGADLIIDGLASTEEQVAMVIQMTEGR